jgi:hypothetical protein
VTTDGAGSAWVALDLSAAGCGHVDGFSSATARKDIPYHVAADYEKIVRINGREVKRAPVCSDLHPSPGGNYIVIADGMQGKPIQIYTIAYHSGVELPTDDESRGHYKCYLFRFFHWEDDSSFLVQVIALSAPAHPRT